MLAILEQVNSCYSLQTWRLYVRVAEEFSFGCAEKECTVYTYHPSVWFCSNWSVTKLTLVEPLNIRQSIIQTLWLHIFHTLARAKFLFSSFFVHADYLNGKTTILCMRIWKQTLVQDSFPSLRSKAESEITIWNFPEARHTSYQVVLFFSPIK